MFGLGYTNENSYATQAFNKRQVTCWFCIDNISRGSAKSFNSKIQIRRKLMDASACKITFAGFLCVKINSLYNVCSSLKGTVIESIFMEIIFQVRKVYEGYFVIDIRSLWSLHNIMFIGRNNHHSSPFIFKLWSLHVTSNEIEEIENLYPKHLELKLYVNGKNTWKNWKTGFLGGEKELENWY